MKNAIVEELGKSLVRHVRDRAIASIDVAASARARGPTATRWAELRGSAASSNEVIHRMTPEIVDATLFFLLMAIGEGALPLCLKEADGTHVDPSDLGGSELAGMYLGDKGWPRQYSTERLSEH